MISCRHLLFGLLIAALTAASPAAAVVLGQIDDFQDGTVQGWITSLANPNPPINVPDVGPAGLGDDSLQITSTGIAGPGGRWVANNLTQWAGDYPTAGVDMIALDVNNIGTVLLNLRLGFTGPGGFFVTTVSLPIAAGSGWQTVAFSIAAANLTGATDQPSLDVNATLAAVSQLRLHSAVNPTWRGDIIVAQGLVDNVIAVPEPAQSLLLAAGLPLVGLLQRRRAVVSRR